MISNTTIAIIGSGLSGTLTAINLLQQGQPLHVVLYEQQPEQLNRGAAYTANNVHQPLNVPIGKMSLYTHDHDHFYNWLHEDPARLAECIYGTERDSYVPRKVFGDYLMDRFLHTLSVVSEIHQIEILSAKVLGVEKSEGGYLLRTTKGDRMFQNVVLATGTVPPQQAIFVPPALRNIDLPIIHSWKGLPKVGSAKQVLIVGSGLSMVDAVIDLERQGYKGNIRVLSLHGLIPQPEVPEPPHDLNLSPLPIALGLFKAFRALVKLAEEQGSGWRSTINNLRPYTHQLWQGLNDTEKQTFMRHLQPYWEVHRHRVPQFSYQLLQNLIAAKRLEVLRGRITNLVLADDGRITVTYRPRHTQASVSFDTDLIVNCTGPVADLSRSGDPLLEQLIQSGLAASGPLKMGLNTNDYGKLLNANGQVQEGLYAMGCLRKGNLWESTALRELRQQAEALPEVLLKKQKPIST